MFDFNQMRQGRPSPLVAIRIPPIPPSPSLLPPPPLPLSPPVPPLPSSPSPPLLTGVRGITPGKILAITDAWR
jgi:hypothetical protein